MNEVTALTQHVLLAFFVMAIAVGIISQRTHFCTMGAIADVVNMGDWTRARQWLLAIGVAMVGFAGLLHLGLIDASKTLYANNRFMWLSSAVGGLMFGYGMVMASGCGNKTLVRIGAGNLKSLVVFLVLGLSAFATLKGITAVVRVSTVDAVALGMPAGADLGALVASLTGLSDQPMAIWSGYVLGAVLMLWVLRHADFWTAENLLASVGMGALIVAMWWVSGHVGFLPEHPETLEAVYLGTNSGRIEAMSFVAPVAHTLDWLMFFSDKSKLLTVGVVSVFGVVVGSAVSSLQQKTFRWEGFASVDDLAQHLMGAALMGVGGVTAMGCTFGQGLSGISTLSLNSFLAVAAIVLGAVLSIRHQVARLERSLG
jgi:uncharacterized membrane protein YedE/YeeE